MSSCGTADLSWQARIRQGVVEYNALSAPSFSGARRGLTGLDGGDLTLFLAQGHGAVAVDGADLADPAWSWPASPLLADGGVIS